jgi:hypothetical protein
MGKLPLTVKATSEAGLKKRIKETEARGWTLVSKGRHWTGTYAIHWAKFERDWEERK